MIKKNTLIATTALILVACSNPTGVYTYPQSVRDAAEAIPAEKQIGYFACSFLRHQSDCQQDIWKTHPNPKLSRNLNSETVKDFLAEVELRGAGRLLDKKGYACGRPQEVSGIFWERGDKVTCADGKQYIVDRAEGEWQITIAPTKN